MANPNVKSFVCLDARRNSMKLMIGCVVPLEVRGCVVVNLETEYARRMGF